jgi:hypothetical protein
MATITTTRNNDLKVKESEIVRLSLENEEHVKRVAELTAYIQQAVRIIFQDTPNVDTARHLIYLILESGP